MKNGSCSFFPNCPPCFGLCDTESAPYDMSDNKACSGCAACKAEKKVKRCISQGELQGADKVSSILTKLYMEKKIKEEAISILYSTIYEVIGENRESKKENS
jgi:uncharacterized protein with ATP-grasp and redox domains